MKDEFEEAVNAKLQIQKSSMIIRRLRVPIRALSPTISAQVPPAASINLLPYVRAIHLSSRLSEASPDHPTVRFVHPAHPVPAPTPTTGPLLSRLPNRSLPSIKDNHTWLRTLPAFIIAITLSALAIFNYQKSSSSTVNSILYALRTNDQAREILGDEMYFASKVPWIRGELNPLQGRIDIKFWVKGNKGQAKVRFHSVRPKRRDAYFETLDWSLETQDGRVIQLLSDDASKDPFVKR